MLNIVKGLRVPMVFIVAYRGISHRGTLVGVHPTIPWFIEDFAVEQSKYWSSNDENSEEQSFGSYLVGGFNPFEQY